jgi:nanoRNase/pAp phosphatase (c-di-AMP/oligoRNAs hydrolase)
MNRRFPLGQALDALQGVKRLLVCPHDDPDPDALAAAWGMEVLLAHELGCETTLAFEGIIGRAENRAMVRELGIRLRRLEGIDPTDYDGVVLVDSQPGAGNHSIPTDLPVLVCIDHHPKVDDGATVPWLDVRPDGECTSTIVLSYLNERGIELPPKLATALLYALKTDTRDLSREASSQDLEAWAQVSAVADKRALGVIINPQLEARYFHELRRALDVAVVTGSAVHAFLGDLPYPDLVAEIADLFVRRKGIQWSLCGGFYGGALRFSLRTEDPKGRAGRLAMRLARGFSGSAGGHGMTAGGRLPLEQPEAAAATWEALVQAWRAEVVVHGEPEPLCP